MSQVASEMYAKLHSYVADVAQALEKHSSAQAMKKQLEYVLKTAQDFYKYLWFEGTSATVDNVRVEVGREEKEAVSTPRWIVGMAMQLLKKFNSMSTYLASTLHGATTATSASRMIKSLQARWKNVYQNMYEVLPVTEHKGLEESRNDKSGGTIADAGSGVAETTELQAEEPAGSMQAENPQVCTDSMEQGSMQAENPQVCTDSMEQGSMQAENPQVCTDSMEQGSMQAENPQVCTDSMEQGSMQAENPQVCTDSMEQGSMQAENRHSLETIREDSCEDQQSTELQSASHEEREQDSPRPRSWISFLRKRS